MVCELMGGSGHHTDSRSSPKWSSFHLCKKVTRSDLCSKKITLATVISLVGLGQLEHKCGLTPHGGGRKIKGEDSEAAGDRIEMVETGERSKWRCHKYSDQV